MKKICFLATCIALISTTVFASPQTDIKKGETSMDIGAFNSKEAFVVTYPKKTNIDAAVTTGISDKIAIQYKYHGLKSDDLVQNGWLLDGAGLRTCLIDNITDAKIQEFNVVYKLSKSTNAFLGVNKFSAKYTYNVQATAAPLTNYAVGYDTDRTRAQIGITSKTSIGKAIDAWGTIAVGPDLVNGELGISKALSPNTDLNLYYRYTNLNNVKYYYQSYDFENNGFGLGVTVKF